MMGNRQHLKAPEYDVVYARKMYCYLVNKHGRTVKFYKNYMSRRRRYAGKEELRNID